MAIGRVLCVSTLFNFLTYMIADKFNFLELKLQNCIADADADLTPEPGKREFMVDADVVPCGLHKCQKSTFADVIVGMVEIDVHDRCRDRVDSRKLEQQPLPLGW